MVRLALAAPSFVGLAACDDSAPTEHAAKRVSANVACTQPARPSPVLRGDTLSLPVARFDTEDRVMDAVSRQVPGGFGGLWLDDGRIVISLVDPSQAAAAREAIAALMSTDPHRAGPTAPAAIRAARIVSARWSFSQLFHWSAVTDPVVWSVEGLVTSDRDEVANRIRYGFIDNSAMHRAAERLGALGLPCDLVLLEVTGPVRTLSGER